MQRQGVPLLQAESPFVGTGIEERAARDSKIVAVAEEAGIVASVDAKRIIITKDGELPRNLKNDPKNGVHSYELRKFMRSNAGAGGERHCGGLVDYLTPSGRMSTSRLPFGRLPGDFHVEREGFSFHFPLTTGLIVSIVISLILWLFRR